ncbi:MAG TPA: hypothetical protein VJU13_07485 [Candidatus Nitrosocosmicus sp.]|nr:hypothetical protein [Candidatus Nitrosocosmicus sp.]
MSITDKKHTTILAVISALAIVMTLSPLGSNFNSNVAFAGGNHHDDDDEDDAGNSASQIIAQVQRSLQNSQVVSGGDIEDSGNNFNFQNQENSGNNAAAQSGGDDDYDDDGNNSNQGIGQSQSSRQNSQCVAGGSLGNSCNNVSFQNQENSGNNAAAQSGGDDDDGNNSNQGIGQDQSNEQNAQCVSGEDAIVSCNNVSFQNQVNSGFNVLGQD